MKNILIDMPVHSEAIARLKSLPGVTVETVEPKEEVRDLPPSQIESVHFLFCTFPPRNLEVMRALEFVQIASAGYGQLIHLGLDGRGIRACNGLGNFDVPIAEWNIAMMVNLARNLRGMIRNQESAVWDRSAVFQKEIRGSVLGIWGYGGIGRETARLAKILGLRVHVMTRGGVNPRREIYRVDGTGDPDGVLPDRIFQTGQEIEFLSALDFLVLAMPLTKSNEGIIGEKELRALPRTAFLLNPARGPLVEEQALLKALGEAWIAGAALDTHYAYPLPSPHPLWRFPNVILTPHISGSAQSPRFLDRIWDIFVQNVVRWLSGQPLLNELSAQQLRAE
jgi:phosphoglycerate dehydrogenase-like enzyme